VAESRRRNDYEMFKPYLKQIMDFEKEFVGYLGYKQNKYDTLLDQYEPDMTTAVLDKVFGDLRDKLVELLTELRERGKAPNNDFLKGHYPADKQKALNTEVLKLMGFDFNRGRVDISAHPFTTSFFNGDVRITNRYDEEYFLSSFFSAMHEEATLCTNKTFLTNFMVRDSLLEFLWVFMNRRAGSTRT